jgi:hypothetical protein
VGNTVADVVTHRRALRRGRPESADRRLRYGRLRRLLAFESRLRRPERRSCLLTAPTSLEMSVKIARLWRSRSFDRRTSMVCQSGDASEGIHSTPASRSTEAAKASTSCSSIHASRESRRQPRRPGPKGLDSHVHLSPQKGIFGKPRKRDSANADYHLIATHRRGCQRRGHCPVARCGVFRSLRLQPDRGG